MNTQTGHRWAVVTAVSGTVFIAAGAFWLSFTALADLAARSGIGAAQAWAWPLIVDGIIVVATVSVVALAGHRSAWYPWVLLIGGAAVSVTANALHSIVAADADVPGLLAASVAAVPPVVLLAITHLTVILTRPLPATDERATDATATEPSVASSSEPEFVALTAPSAGGSTLEPSAAVEQDPSADAIPRAPDRRERAWQLHQRGRSNKKIADELGVHPSTVGRWFASAHLPDDLELTNAEEMKDP